MRRSLRAGLAYFAIVFGVGFLLGPVRVLWAVPRFGERTAELLEAAMPWLRVRGTLGAAMKRSLLLAALLWGVASVPSPGAARCLSYEPATVVLTGKLTSRTVPGPPNYASIARGDLPETIFVLVLSEPVCVSADAASLRNSKAHANVTEVQLVVRGSAPRALLRQQVRVSGSLSGARSGHHRTPVVLTVRSLRAS